MKFKFNYYRSTQFILILLLIATTYIGIPINGGEKGWIYVNGLLQYFYAKQFRIFHNMPSILYSFFTFSVLLINVLLYITPIFIFTKYNKIGSIYIPTIFLLLTLAYFPLMIILLIPYILIWLALFIYSKYTVDKSK